MFLLQSDKTSCGPIAIINALIWKRHINDRPITRQLFDSLNIGKKIDTKLNQWRSILGTDATGTHPDNIELCLQSLFNIRVTTNHTELKKHLYSGDAAIVLYYYHYIFVFSYFDHYYSVNDSEHFCDTFQDFHEKFLKEMYAESGFLQGNKFLYPKIWLLN